MYTDLQPDKVPPTTTARIRTCPIPEQQFPHKFTDNTAERCQVSNYNYDYTIFSSQINKCSFLKLVSTPKIAWTGDYTDQLVN